MFSIGQDWCLGLIIIIIIPDVITMLASSGRWALLELNGCFMKILAYPLNIRLKEEFRMEK